MLRCAVLLCYCRGLRTLIMSCPRGCRRSVSISSPNCWWQVGAGGSAAQGHPLLYSFSSCGIILFGPQMCRPCAAAGHFAASSAPAIRHAADFLHSAALPLCVDPVRRPTMAEILRHPWVSEGMLPEVLNFNDSLVANSLASPPPQEVGFQSCFASLTLLGSLRHSHRLHNSQQPGHPAPTVARRLAPTLKLEVGLRLA